MTDRELLEAASKAAGIETHGWRAHESRPGLYMLPITETGAYVVWNPLTDDGDALRLAVALNIWPFRRFDRATIEVQHGAAYWDTLAEEPIGDDALAATRRAIVRAAAAMAAKEPR
jgi:hypothetical protein